MRSVKSLIVAGAASLFCTAAVAADMSLSPAPEYTPPPPPADFGGWYLRGDIGFSNQSVKNIRSTNAAVYAPVTALSETTAFDSGGIFDVGVGYRFNNWFRADITGQYRGKSNFKGSDVFTATDSGGLASGYDGYSASKSEVAVLANLYADLGTWWGVTPFVGAGIGTARVSITNFTDNGLYNGPSCPGCVSAWTAANGSKWNFAWAAHAGLAYQVNPNMALELAYSFMDLGNGMTGVAASFDGTTSGHAFKFNDITSHDLKLGVRWNLDALAPAPVYAPPPITKG